MPSYTAPVDDMMFLFEKLRNNQKYNELEKYNEDGYLIPNFTMPEKELLEIEELHNSLIKKFILFSPSSSSGSFLKSIEISSRNI